jgi:spore germination cell wall hydrolase CwlJ-like protein
MRRSRFNALIVVFAVLLLAVGAAATYYYTQLSEQQAAGDGPQGGGAVPPGSMLPNLPPPDLLRPITPQEAQAANAERPVVTRPDAPASQFRLSGDAISRLRAVDCLTQAIYYEAASEGVDGGRAVAQVVLNRVRHPGYPNSVCGVVYQGSMRATGCQFSFTCDGSLARTPVGYLWARSRLIATEALAGRVFAPVGHASHYHADYVLPYWADSLDKVAVIGRHIFYRLRGISGSRSAFRQPYAASEPAPPTPSTTDVIEESLDAVAADPEAVTMPELPRVEEDRVEALGTAAKPLTVESLPLEADLGRGQLILGEPAPSGKPKRPAQESCATGGVGQIKAIGAENMKAGAATAGC